MFWLRDKMIRELQIIGFLREFLPSISNKSIDDVFLFFKNLAKKDDFNSLYILNYLHKFICSNEVSKRKSSARELEDFIATLFKGEITDSKARSNEVFEISDYFSNVKDIIASNKREKADILFKSYALSIKTLILKNAELNMGSFEKRVLFDGLGLDGFLSERKSASGIGLGSSSQLQKLIEVINLNEKLNKFFEKFLKMSEFVFSDDLLVAIKENHRISLYFFSGYEFNKIVESHLSKERFCELFTRYEGNSLRIKKDSILKHCDKKVVLEFERLNGSVLDDINRFDLELHRAYTRYFNGDLAQKERIVNELKRVFCGFRY